MPHNILIAHTLDMVFNIYLENKYVPSYISLKDLELRKKRYMHSIFRNEKRLGTPAKSLEKSVFLFYSAVK